MNFDDILRQLTANAEAVRALVQTISSEQAFWKPDPETWCMQEVMEHLYNEERLDFRKHLQEMFHEPPLAWGASEPKVWHKTASCAQALELFLAERADSLAWLRALQSPDWDKESRATFGPDNGVISLRAGDVFVSWLAHDFLHIRQLNELHYAWIQAQASPYAVDYAGGW